MDTKLSGRFFFVVLSISLLSYGISGAAYAAVAPISVETNKEFYVEGATITISGFVKDFDTSDPMLSTDVVIRIVAPNGNFVFFGQTTPNADGNYSTSVTAGGEMKAEGDYTVKVNWGAQSNDIEFKYAGSGTASVPSESQPDVELEPVAVDEEPTIETIEESVQPVCGSGTVLKNGLCVPEEKSSGGGCLIATAAFGSELAPQVQFLREIRDNTVLQTQSGSTFMTGFNQFYYSFSPAIADYERENPAFKEAVKIAITPMLTSLAILNYVDIDSEEEMLGYGIGIILLNIGMYFIAPAVIIFKIKNRK